VSDPTKERNAEAMLRDEQIRDLCNKAILLTNRSYLVREHCTSLGVDHSDVFAKARAYAGAMHDVQRLGVMQYGVPIESRPGPTVTMRYGGIERTMVMLASNDYLNLSTDARVHEAITKTLRAFGVGAGSCRAATGYSRIHRMLEEKLAHAYRKEAALLYPTGFDAIAGPILALCGEQDRVLVDGSSHACIIEGANASGAAVRMFPHNSAAGLKRALERSTQRLASGGILTVIEGAYSMDGDIAPLPDLAALCKSHGARLLIDEAHSIGVYGDHGHGVVEHFGLEADVDLIAGTFSKSLGSCGGFVAGSRDVITYLNYMSRKIVFSAALPAALVAGVDAAFDIMEAQPELRGALWDNVQYLISGLQEQGATILGQQTASVPVFIGNDEIMFTFAHDLSMLGVFAYPAVFPLVPRDRSLFRLAVQAAHTRPQLDRVIDAFGRLLRKYGVDVGTGV
jgi:7-keto-8-aminopelargonate synthetase-like enzyme